MSEDTSLLNSKELAAALRVDPGTITNWLKAKAITPEIHEGRTIRFNLEAVKAQLKKRAKTNSR